jgi:hypothetical protein
LNDITVESVALMHHRFDETPFGQWLIDTAMKVSLINKSEANSWRNELMERDVNGRFIATVNIVVVSGTKP